MSTTSPPAAATATTTATATATATLPRVTGGMAYELAVEQGVCVRPLLRRVLDQATGTDTRVAIPCGSTRETVCPSCAAKARRLRMQQCAEGWHRTDEPELTRTGQDDEPDQHDELDQDDEQDQADELADLDELGGSRRVRSTRRRQDVPDLPRVAQSAQTVGRVYAGNDGREYRPSMFLTLTLPSYGPIRDGVPVDPDTYDYRSAAIDALLFPRLVDRFWSNLRRCAGYRVQYFAAVEEQKRLAPHLHAAIRGTIPRSVLRQVVAATYVQMWWPRFDRPTYVRRLPVWVGDGYADPDTGELLPTWEEALDQAARADQPAAVLRFGTQLDAAGLVAPSPGADKAVRYLTKYLAKAIASTHTDPDGHPAREAHIDRLHDQLVWLPCSERCANWLRFGVQPDQAGPGLRPGQCPSKSHDRENLGLGGRRVLVSRAWSGKTLKQHRADRATVVREALLSAGILAPEVERLATTVTLPDGRPRYVWTDLRPDPITYARVIMDSIAERIRWRQQYETAKTHASAPGDTRSATQTDPDG